PEDDEQVDQTKDRRAPLHGEAKRWWFGDDAGGHKIDEQQNAVGQSFVEGRVQRIDKPARHRLETQIGDKELRNRRNEQVRNLYAEKVKQILEDVPIEYAEKRRDRS